MYLFDKLTELSDPADGLWFAHFLPANKGTETVNEEKHQAKKDKIKRLKLRLVLWEL